MDGVGSNVKVVEEKPRPRIKFSDAGLRILALALTLVAAIVFGLGNETKVVTVQIMPSLPAVQVPATAKWQYVSAFVYFIVVNAIACSYAAVSLVFSFIAGRSILKESTSSLTLVILDFTITALLFTAEGAAIAVGLIGKNGNSHLKWNKVCNVFDGFCRQSIVAVILSLLGTFVFFWLVVVSILTLHRKSR